MRSIYLLSFVLVALSCNNIETNTASLHNKIDLWHNAAATANYNSYFNFIAEEGIFIGTDISERWNKKEFSEFSKPYFDNGKAWSFTPKERIIRYSKDKATAWFDEILDTWMGECRATGVLVFQEGNWKLAHYQLSVTIDNELMPQFLELINKRQDD